MDPEERQPWPAALPPTADAAIGIVRTLRAAGHVALLAGGCVRDLLLGHLPQDFDVAADAGPQRVQALFRATRHVGAQFGVVLVRSQGRWVEVATFRTDAEYLDGRRPVAVTFGDARTDALRRDFTVNGMFLDPIEPAIIDYVGGRRDLAARCIRAIGTPEQRFAEDHLRLLRAVRFAARLGFQIEPRTLAAIGAHAPRLRRVSPERVRDELERMLSQPGRARAVELLGSTGLLYHLWERAAWDAAELSEAVELLRRLPHDAPFELAFAILIAHCGPAEIERIARALACSNEQREAVAWLVAHQADLDAPRALCLAALKRLLARREFEMLHQWADARRTGAPDADQRAALLRERLDAIPPESVAPAPLVTGDDLLARRVEPGPIYKRILDELYTRQLEELLRTRDEALRSLDALLGASNSDGPAPGSTGGVSS